MSDQTPGEFHADEHQAAGQPYVIATSPPTTQAQTARPRRAKLITVPLLILLVAAVAGVAYRAGRGDSQPASTGNKVSATATAGTGNAGGAGAKTPTGPDSGVAACERLRTFQGVGTISTEYARALSSGFVGSRHDDLRATGAAFAATLTEIKQLPNDGTALGRTLELAGKGVVEYGSLRVTCGAHGTNLPAWS